MANLNPNTLESRYYPGDSSLTIASFFLISLLFCTAIEVKLFLMVDAGTLSPIIYLLVHLIVTLFIGFITWHYYRQKWDYRMLFICLLMVVVTGPIGLIGGFIGQFIFVYFRSRAMAFDDWYEALFPEETLRVDEVFSEKLEGVINNPHDAERLIPFRDLLRFGNIAQKQAVITMMAQHFNAGFGPLLRHALQDENNAVRVHAVSSITFIVNRLEQQGERLKEKLAEEGGGDNLLELAKYYDEFAFSSLIDEALQQEYRDKALEHYQDYLLIHAESQVVEERIGRMLLRYYTADRAERWLYELLERGDASINILIWYLESLYNQRKYAEIRKAIIRYQYLQIDIDAIPEPVQDAMAIWQAA